MSSVFSDDADPPNRRTLHMIAEALGCPVEAFSDPTHAPEDVRQWFDLIAAWSAIEKPEDRAHVIEYARHLAQS